MTGRRTGGSPTVDDTPLVRHGQGPAVEGTDLAGVVEDLRAYADEQAALRRIAEQVVRGAGDQTLFDTITAEVAAQVRGRATALVRRTGARSVVVLASVDGPGTGRTVDLPLDDPGVVAAVLRTDRSVRVDDLTPSEVSLVADSDDMIGSAVAVPVVVAAQTWGVLVVVANDPFPDGTEQRLAPFAELTAAAVETSRSRRQAKQIVEQQRALRRVAELAVQDVPAEEVLRAVVSQASRLAAVNFSTMLRFEPDGSTEVVALDGAPAGVAVGMRAPGDGDGATQRVWRTGRPARIDDLAAVSGRWATVAHDAGFVASAAVPILITGRLWGALVVVGREPLPPTTEEQLGDFAELTATAVAAAQARTELRLLAEEQAALRRVAELTARGATLDEVFGAVTREASMLLGGPSMTLVRYDPDGSARVVAAHASPAPVGLHVPTDPASSLTKTWLTGRPTRINGFSGTTLQQLAAEIGVGAALSVPVTVDQRIWGALNTSTSGPPPPEGVEVRLMQFAEMAAVAIAGAESRADLIASRARIVAAGDEARHRLQRDVHDGAQQRLVHAIIALKLARAAASDDLVSLLDEALVNAERANRELRDVVRGILPAALTSGGLRAAVQSVSEDLPLPVDLDLEVPRLPAATETAAYFLVVELLTNVVKHAAAGRATVRAAVHAGRLSLTVTDDGIGGADPATGTGLTGLRDRTDAAGGTLTIDSPPGGGTAVHATLPIDARDG